jgi:hypothetical protein
LLGIRVLFGPAATKKAPYSVAGHVLLTWIPRRAEALATKVAPHAILILDQAGWHGVKELRIPANISLLPLPPRSPERQKNIWQFMRQNCLSDRIFKSFDDIIDHCCYAWNTVISQPVEDHLHRATRLGDRRSLILRMV